MEESAPVTLDIRSNTQVPPQDFEMDTLASHNETSEIPDQEIGSESVSELQPVDRGRGAWGYLVGAFIVDSLTWGFPLSFGVFQKHLSTQPPFNRDGSASVIGTLATAFTYLGAPLIMRIISRFPKFRVKLVYIGLALRVISCFAASFSTRIWHLILTQGALYGIGCGLVYIPTLSYMNEWFVQRRGFASGIMYGGAGMSGLVLPLLFEKGLDTIGYANTLRIWGLVLGLLTTPTIYYLIKGRLPVSQVSVARRLNLSFFKSPLFLVVAFSNLFQGLGYFIPSIYLPSYASDLAMTSIEATLVLSLLNMATVVGQVFAGHLSDRWGSTTPFFLSTTVGALSVCLLWGFSKSFAPLVIFSLIYGISAGGYSVLWSRFSMEIAHDDPHMQLTIFGVFAFERGIGNVIAGPISSILLGSKEHVGSYAIRKYEGMILFTGMTMVASSLSVLLSSTSTGIRR